MVIGSRGVVEEAVVGEDGHPGAAVEGVVGLDEAGQAVGEHDDRLLLARRDGHLRGLVIDDERRALAVARQGVVGDCSRAGRWP